MFAVLSFFSIPGDAGATEALDAVVRQQRVMSDRVQIKAAGIGEAAGSRAKAM